MLYLWVFGDNVEDAMGHARFLLFSLACGVLAPLAQVAVDPANATPLIGASGAISGVLGAYLILHPRARVLVPIVFIPLYLPAWLLLIFWFGFQFVSAFGGPAADNVGWWAHIGGFVAGVILVFVLRYKAVPLRSEEHTSELQSLMRISYAVFCLKKIISITRQLEHQHMKA